MVRIQRGAWADQGWEVDGVKWLEQIFFFSPLGGGQGRGAGHGAPQVGVGRSQAMPANSARRLREVAGQSGHEQTE